MHFQLSPSEESERKTNQIVPTLNQMGYMSESLNYFTHAFVEFCEQAGQPVLDVGTAFGFTTIKALEKGAQVIANDVDPNHLEKLMDNLSEEQKNRLILKPGYFPHDLDFPPNSLSGILVSRILHFLSGHEIEIALKKMLTWLEPNGKIFIVAETPYKQLFERFIPYYEKQKKNGLKWPGEVENIHQYMNKRIDTLPKFMNLLEEEILKNAVLESGFLILESRSFSKSNLPEDAQMDGRESAGIIATKPN